MKTPIFLSAIAAILVPTFVYTHGIAPIQMADARRLQNSRHMERAVPKPLQDEIDAEALVQRVKAFNELYGDSYLRSYPEVDDVNIKGFPFRFENPNYNSPKEEPPLEATPKPKFPAEKKHEIPITEDKKDKHNLPPDLEKIVNANAISLVANKSTKAALENTFSEITRYKDSIQSAAEETGLGQNLIEAVMAKESRGKLRVYSNAGAAGPMQLMPVVAKYMGLKMDGFVDERFGPESILAGAKYLQGQLEKYKSLHLALASYNLGPTKLNEIISKYGTGWNNIKGHLPKETRGYVASVLSRMRVLEEHKDKLDIAQMPLHTEMVKNSHEHVVRPGQSISRIARIYGRAIEKIKELNPTIREYSLIVPGLKILVPKS